MFGPRLNVTEPRKQKKIQVQEFEGSGRSRETHASKIGIHLITLVRVYSRIDAPYKKIYYYREIFYVRKMITYDLADITTL